MKIPLHLREEKVSRIGLGCMEFGGGWDDSPINSTHIKHMHEAIDAALEVGIHFFDHADIYKKGKAEQVFGQVLKARPELREQIVLQSKCGIRLQDESGSGRYDFSADWIRTSVENTLTRLNIQQLDVLLLHRPDPLMQPEEIAKVFNELHETGKVKYFGVSNMHAYQIQFLQHYLDHPLIVNQLEMSLLNHHWIDEGFNASRRVDNEHTFSPGIIEHCQLQNIQLQAWGCLAQGLFSGKDLSGQSERIVNTANLVANLAAAYQTTPEAIVLGWLMRHPAGIQPIIGTTNKERIKACSRAKDLLLNRNHWYDLLVTIRGEAIP